VTAIYTKFSRTGVPVLNVDDAGGVGLPAVFQHGLCGDARFEVSETARLLAEVGAVKRFSLRGFAMHPSDFGASLFALGSHSESKTEY
jgi:hypothetical protein